MSKSPMPESRKLIFLVVSVLFVCGVCIVGGITARITNFRVEGFAMEPTVHDRDYVFVTAAPYMLQPPQRGDVIVFRYPLNPRKNFIKRVIGLPGETIQVRAGNVWINGAKLNEPSNISSATYEFGPVTVGADEYFVLGDNRNESSDSHAWGMLPAQEIVGKAWYIYWPPESASFVQ